MAGTLTVATKELRDQFGSKRFLILFGLVLLLSTLAAYQGVDFIRNNTQAGFVYIFSGTQMSFSFIQTMVYFGPLLGLALGFDAINKERATGTLSILLGQPIFRDSVINGKLIAGATALTTLVIGTIGIMCGVSIPLLGFGPTLTETSKIVALALLTIVYLVFWLSLGILYSVLTKRTATSIMASIATWLTFSIIITILASVVAGFIVPLPGGTFRSQTEGGGMQISPEFREAMEERAAVTSTIQKISPTNLYEEAASDILGVVGGFMRGMGHQEFQRTLTLGEALAANWANIATIVVGLVICFAASYMIFLRSEIRPGD
ncbi:MAG TPA: ABC transporter permease [Patescibacteria group bacterium]|nr:ABC transporter permease [Patescibacteria group bacterium]